ncbi:MAG: DUF429 domain-containing protein [Thermoplasmata archaeon]|nr:DUF429 domain-containing protein [Thermoplasmata archaeon]
MRKLGLLAVGIDLAWTRKNPSALAVVSERLEVVDLVLRRTDAEILAFVESHDSERKIVCIDAPLIFPAEVMAFRKCETLLRKKGIRILPVQQEFCIRRFGCLRGQELVKMLEERGYKLSIRCQQKQIIEVYPHATWKRMLGNVPRYKNVARAKKREAIARMHRALVKAGLRGIENLDLEMTGISDLLDAVVCAVAGIWHFRGRAEVIGNEKEGFIVY